MCCMANWRVLIITQCKRLGVCVYVWRHILLQLWRSILPHSGLQPNSSFGINRKKKKNKQGVKDGGNPDES